MNNIKVSIIIPIYNVERYVRKTIESVQHQDFEAYEIILVDDGSKDNSGRICDEYATGDGRIRVVHQQNGGVMSARFAGVKVARGEYIAFLDGDDRMPPTAILNMYTAITENNVDYVNGFDISIDLQGNKIGPINGTGFDGIIDGNKIYRRFIATHPKGMNLKMYRKDLLLESPIVVVDPKIKNNEDFIFNLFLSSKVNRIMSIPNVVAHIVEHTGSASRVFYPSDYWLYVIQWMDDNYKNYDIYDDDYMLYKLNMVYYKLLREKRGVDYSLSCFDNIRCCHYHADWGLSRNIAIFAIRHPNILVLSLLRFHPKRLLRINK